MTLQTVKEFIDSVEDIPFREFFSYYVMRVQDSNIDEEVRFFLVNNNVDILTAIHATNIAVDRW